MRGRTAMLLTLGCATLGCATLGCGGAAVPPPAHATRVAVLPVRWATEDPFPALEEGEALVEGLREASGISVVRVAPEPACTDDDADCARGAGQRAEADRVVVASMAALGSTVLLRASVLEVARGTREQTRQEVVTDPGERASQDALRRMGLLLGEALAPARPTPLYEEAWLWGTVGGVLALGLAGAIVGVALEAQDRGPDVTVVPP